jgi:hypothetical protein
VTTQTNELQDASKDKIFALPGFSFRVEVSDPSILKKNRHGNSLIIGISYNRRSEIDSNTTVTRREIRC